MMPFAPKSTTVSSAEPLLEQSLGTVLKAASPMSWNGILAATSPAILTSASLTDPHVYPSTYW